MNKDIHYLKKLFSEPFDAKRAGGQTNRNYVVSFRKPFNPFHKVRVALKDLKGNKFRARKFFVRLPWENVLNRKTEGKNILALSCNKKVQRILPRYFVYVLSKRNILDPKDKNRYSVPDGTMATEYIPGREFSMRHFRQVRYQRALARTFHVFHASGVRFSNPYDPFRNEINKYRVAAFRHTLKKLLGKETIAQLKKLELKAQQRLRSLKRGVSTHNDFIFSNFLVGRAGRIYLLDFEYAGLNKKGGIFYDIGYPLRDSFFNPPQISKKTFESFLNQADKAYKRKLDREQIYWSIVAALLVGIWWGVLRYYSVPKKEQPYFLRYVQRGVKGLLGLVHELKEKREPVLPALLERTC